MANFDYSKTLAKSLQLVEKFGRAITFVKLGEVSEDPTKPWHGASDVRTNPSETVTANGVFVHPESLKETGRRQTTVDFVSKVDQIAIVAFAGSLDQFSEIIDDDGSRWKIETIDTLRPGSVTVLHFVSVRR